MRTCICRAICAPQTKDMGAGIPTAVVASENYREKYIIQAYKHV